MASREMLEDVVERLTEQLKVAAESLKSTSEDFRQALEKIETLKQALCEAPVLAFPRFDLPFVLDTDTSTTGVAAVFGTEAFYPYLISKQFVARLDHRSLVWLQTFKQPKPQEARWVEYLQQFDMKIEHQAGRLHANADGLSRRPWPAT